MRHCLDAIAVFHHRGLQRARNVNLRDYHFNSLADCPPLRQTAALEALRRRETEAMAAMRAHNESKLLPAADCMDLTVCVCQEAPMGAMLQCELCRDAFHSVCVRDLYDDSGATDRQPWLCPLCRRSEAPPMSEVLPLLAAVQRCCRGGRVRLPEADALHFLVERAVSWQHRARQNTDELRLQEMQEGPGTPPTLTRWASGNNNNTAAADGHAQVCLGKGFHLTCCPFDPVVACDTSSSSFTFTLRAFITHFYPKRLTF